MKINLSIDYFIMNKRKSMPKNVKRNCFAKIIRVTILRWWSGWWVFCQKFVSFRNFLGIICWKFLLIKKKISYYLDKFQMVFCLVTNSSQNISPDFSSLLSTTESISLQRSPVTSKSAFWISSQWRNMLESSPKQYTDFLTIWKLAILKYLQLAWVTRRCPGWFKWFF